jgi:hypothetical protein
MKLNIRILYLYLFSSVGLIVATIGAVRLVELGLKVYVFQGADQFDYYTTPAIPAEKSADIQPVDEAKQKQIQETETKRQRQREASGAIAMLLVGLPLYKYHWNIIQKENTHKETKKI